MTNIVFVGELPPRTSQARRSKYDRDARALKRNANVWARMAICADAVVAGTKAQALRNTKAFREPGFEVVSRTSKGVSAVYARYSTAKAEEQEQEAS